MGKVPAIFSAKNKSASADNFLYMTKHGLLENIPFNSMIFQFQTSIDGGLAFFVFPYMATMFPFKPPENR